MCRVDSSVSRYTTKSLAVYPSAVSVAAVLNTLTDARWIHSEEIMMLMMMMMIICDKVRLHVVCVVDVVVKVY